MDPEDAADDEPQDATPDGDADVPDDDNKTPSGLRPVDPEAIRAVNEYVRLSKRNRDAVARAAAAFTAAVEPARLALGLFARQQASWARAVVVPDLKQILPRFTAPVVSYPGLDQAVKQMAQSVLAGFDIGKIIPRFDFSELFRVPPGGWDTWWANWWPPNWERDVDLDAVEAVLNDDGLPLVWVPRSEVVTEVLAAATRADRVAVLVARREQVVEDCRAVLAEVVHPRLSTQQRLLTAAVEALAAGHDDAAQALAVLVTETAVLQAAAAGHIDGVVGHKGLYDRVKDTVRLDLDDSPVWLVRLAASLAPVAGFFTKFHPHRGDPVPEGMSRHVTVHFAFDEHYREEHAVVAVLLMVSVARGLQQGWETWEGAEGSDG